MHALDVIQPKISRHLALLRDLDVVSSRRQGQWIYYQLGPELPSWALSVIKSLQQGVTGTLPFSSDIENLKNMPNRPGSACIA
jgi:ArsR family transcriptional regulator